MNQGWGLGLLAGNEKDIIKQYQNHGAILRHAHLPEALIRPITRLPDVMAPVLCLHRRPISE